MIKTTEEMIMPRPRKFRKVCSLPKNKEFRPQNKENKIVTLTVDEFEAIRLIDKENFSQTEASVYMQVSRPTVQQIYNSARSKIANALVCGFGILIEGGDYTLCDGKEKQCGCGGCPKHRKTECQKKVNKSY